MNLAQPPAPPAPAPAATRIRDEAADLRLVIEEDHGLFIYKTINRRTGDVVQILPREQLVRLHDQNAGAGVVIDTTA